jgi:hypothetical protein
MQTEQDILCPLIAPQNIQASDSLRFNFIKIKFLRDFIAGKTVPLERNEFCDFSFEQLIRCNPTPPHDIQCP